jgi:hypothetical protein
MRHEDDLAAPPGDVQNGGSRALDTRASVTLPFSTGTLSSSCRKSQGGGSQKPGQQEQKPGQGGQQGGGGQQKPGQQQQEPGRQDGQQGGQQNQR